MSDRLLVGVIVGAHGVRGLVRVKAFTEDEHTLAAHGPLTDENGQRTFTLTPRNRVKGAVLCAVAGVADRTAAEGLKGTRLYLERAALPRDTLDEDEFFLADLVGLRVERTGGEILGVVRAVENFGAGDVLDVLLPDQRRSVMLPFTRAVVPVVDVAGGRLVVDPPLGLLDDETDDATGETSS
ncbi:ribosome maturation factor RimM [Pararhodospirillum photometricum]|uniref:Ribosome maturation factor RimM n=1 Tax=Pararhodospirillum photometricum DSM 122 TaxID=1150469 RepID=H6SL75_PARPM|nr:Ribosome maturation factor rimM [Pararhodospirillum photometricum DSM 122]